MNAQMTNMGGIASLQQNANSQAMQGVGQPMDQSGLQTQQEQTPDGGQQKAKIAPDLAKLLAMQKMKEMHDAAQRNAMLQQQMPGGTIMQQLAAQLQPAQQPMAMGAPQGGLTQLPSHLGQHYAGGGIVAFDGGDLVENPDDNKSQARLDLERALAALREPSKADALREAARAQQNEQERRQSLDAAQNANPLLQYFFSTRQQAKDADYVKQHLPETRNYDSRIQRTGVASEAPAVAQVPLGNEGRHGPLAVDPRSVSKAGAATGTGAGERTGIVAALKAPAASALSPNSDLDRLKKEGFSQLDRNDATESENAYQTHLRRAGLDEIMKGKEADIKGLDALFRQQQEAKKSRGWIDALAALGSSKDPRLGLYGGAQAANEYFSKTAAADQAAELAHGLEQMKLRDEIRKARAEGNEKAANAGEKQLDRINTEKNSARSALASAINTEESNKRHLQETAMRMQEMHARANDAAAQRNDQKLQQLLATSYAAAESAANNETSAAAKQAAAMAKDFDAGAYKQAAMARSLANNPVYQKVLKDLNIAAPTAGSDAGSAVKLTAAQEAKRQAILAGK